MDGIDFSSSQESNLLSRSIHRKLKKNEELQEAVAHSTHAETYSIKPEVIYIKEEATDYSDVELVTEFEHVAHSSDQSDEEDCLPEANVGTTLHNSPNDAENARDFAEKNAEDEGEMKSDENISTTNYVPVNNGNKIKSEPPQEVDLNFQINNVLTSIEATEFDNLDDEEQLPAKKKFRSSPGESNKAVKDDELCGNKPRGGDNAGNMSTPEVIYIKEEIPDECDEKSDAECENDDDSGDQSEKEDLPYLCRINRRLHCTICGKSFRRLHGFSVHVRIHTGDKPYTCEMCGKEFRDSRVLKVHIRTHTKEKPYSCKVCGKTFSQLANATAHMRTHTNEKPHACQICGKTFITSSNVTAHMRTHTKEKPYACNVCGKRFAQSTNVTVHMRIHTKEKPYVCTVCNKTFSRSENLTTHMRTHTKEKPYPCKVCGKTFSKSSDVTRHTRIHSRTHTKLHAEQKPTND